MLNLTKKTGYGLVALAYLASPPGRVASASKIARRFEIPVRLLMNVMKELSAAGLVESVRGARGGYVLVRDPGKLTLGELVRTMERPLEMAQCLSAEQGKRQCRRFDRCPARWPVHRVQEKLKQFMDQLTLADITAEGPELVSVEVESGDGPDV